MRETMSYFAVYLESGRFVVLQRSWIKNTLVGQTSKVFISRNENTHANFNANDGFYVDKNSDLCYNAFIFKEFDSEDEAASFIKRKRKAPPVFYKFCTKFESKKTSPVAYIDLCDSSDSESVPEGNSELTEKCDLPSENVELPIPIVDQNEAVACCHQEKTANEWIDYTDLPNYNLHLRQFNENVSSYANLCLVEVYILDLFN